MYDRRSTGHRQAGGAGPPHQVGEVLPTTQSNLLLLRFYLGHKQDALSTPGGEIEQHQGFRKDDTIEGTGDSKVATKNAGMCHSYETSCTIGTRQIQRMVLDHYKDEKSANKIVVLTAWARNDIIWWVNLNECNMSLRSVPVWGSERLATDAMDYAIGSIFRGAEMYEVLDCNKAKQTIAHKEWMAFSRTIRLNLESLKDSIISWHVDNQNVRQAWLNR